MDENMNYKDVTVSIDKNGYEYFVSRAHPLSYGNGVVYMHRHVASVHRGKWLKGDEHVHHIDENKTNNLPENLMILSRSEHSTLHNRRSQNGTTLLDKVCEFCAKSFSPDNQQSKYCSVECYAHARRRVSRPSAEKLSRMISSMTWCAIGLKYGVSDNAVRKWARSYGIL